jgi:5'-AMP-activated protein kinase catalytic alpha subunit
MSEGYFDIKNYSFEKDIGEGNFGKVKLGIYKPTREEFAIKVLNKDKIKIKMKNSIFKENQIITKFNHINVIYVFNILEDEDNIYIIMEYCKQGELFDYIVKNERLSEEEASIFFYQLINGIEHIHSKGIAHRDLKPVNLLLDENNILKIIDFGLSHEFLGDGDELLKTKCGSPSYAAPEIISCPFYDGFKVDVWCSGIILYAMVCGYLPFEGDDNDVLFKNILECNPEFPEFLSDISKDIIMKILNPDPENRITLEEIKKHNFYLMGKILCTIDYDSIENNVIKRRNIIFKNSAKNSERSKSNKPNDNDVNIIKNNDYNTINGASTDTNRFLNDKIYENNLIIQNNDGLNDFKQKLKEIKVKNSSIDNNNNNKIQQILKTDINDINKISSRKIKNISSNQTKNIKTISNNNNNEKNKLKNLNFIDQLKDDKCNKKYKNNTLFIKIRDSAKTTFLNYYKKFEKLNQNKYNIYKTNVEKNKFQNKNKNKKSTNKSKSKYNNNEIKTIDNNHLISLSNDNLKNTQANTNTNTNNNNKKQHKFNLFKKALKSKNKGSNKFSIVKALSNYERNENKKDLNSPYISKKSSLQSNTNSNSVTRTNKNKEINLIAPNSNLYYNNINININELNINSKPLESKRPRIISSLINNKRMKSLSKNKTTNNTNINSNINNTFKSLENNNYIHNKAISAKRLFSYNNKNKRNKKNNKSIRTDINTYYTNNNHNNFVNGNIYTITSDFINHKTVINTITSNDVNNVNNLKKNFRNKNMTKNNKSKSKPRGILSTEPKEVLKFRKQFSFDKANGGPEDIKNNVIDVNLKKRKNEKRSKSEKVNRFRTINTDMGKNTLYNKKFNKKNSVYKQKNKCRYDINKIDELFLRKFIEQKYNKKKNYNKDINNKNCLSKESKEKINTKI